MGEPTFFGRSRQQRRKTKRCGRWAHRTSPNERAGETCLNPAVCLLDRNKACHRMPRADLAGRSPTPRRAKRSTSPPGLTRSTCLSTNSSPSPAPYWHTAVRAENSLLTPPEELPPRILSIGARWVIQASIRLDPDETPVCSLARYARRGRRSSAGVRQRSRHSLVGV